MPPLPELPGVRHTDHRLPTGVTLHVAEAGDPGAPAILAVHGWPQHWWLWRDLIPVLGATHRVICPDLRGFGWSGQPDDRDFAKERLADDLLALLDVLGLDRVGYLGHDWGGWTGWLAAIRAPERFTRLMLVSIIHPWTPRGAALRHGWRLAYQYPLAAPWLGPGARARRPAGAPLPGPRDGRRDGRGLRRRAARPGARAGVEPALPRTSSCATCPRWRSAGSRDARVDLPVKLLFPRGDAAQHVAQLGGLERHAPQADVEVVDGGHFLVDEQPGLVADRARAWFG